MRGTSKNTVFADGPLGLDNYRQQLGRSAALGTATPAGLKAVLIYTGATQKHNKLLPNGMGLRAHGDAAASLLQISCTYRSGNAAATARPLQIRGQIDGGTDGHQCTAYFDWLKEVGDDRFIVRDEVFRSRKELAANMQNAMWEIEDMLRMDLHIYPNATGDWYCIKCPFRGPCIASNDGSDAGFMLTEMYEQNMDEEGNYTLV
jgi:hypothetical protein